MNKCVAVFVLLIIAVFSFPTFAEEVQATVAKPETNWLLIVLSHLVEVFVSILCMVLAVVATWLKKKAGDNQAAQDAIDALKAGAESAWISLGREFAVKAGDGKMTDEEKTKLREHAIAKAKEVATGPAKDLLLKWGTDICSAKLKDIVLAWKAKNVSNPTLPPVAVPLDKNATVTVNP